MLGMLAEIIGGAVILLGQVVHSVFIVIAIIFGNILGLLFNNSF